LQLANLERSYWKEGIKGGREDGWLRVYKESQEPLGRRVTISTQLIVVSRRAVFDIGPRLLVLKLKCLTEGADGCGDGVSPNGGCAVSEWRVQVV